MKTLSCVYYMDKFDIPAVARKHLVQILVQQVLVCESIKANALNVVSSFESKIDHDISIEINRTYSGSNCTTVKYKQSHGRVDFGYYNDRAPKDGTAVPELILSESHVSFSVTKSASPSWLKRAYKNGDEDYSDINLEVFVPGKSVLDHTQEEMFNIVLGWNESWVGFYAAALFHEFQRISHLFKGEMGMALPALMNADNHQALIEMLWNKANPTVREMIQSSLVQYRPLLPEISEYIPE